MCLVLKCWWTKLQGSLPTPLIEIINQEGRKWAELIAKQSKALMTETLSDDLSCIYSVVHLVWKSCIGGHGGGLEEFN